MEKISAVIFDMDGVLLDTETICKICWEKACAEMNLSGCDEIFRKCVGCNTSDTREMVKKYFLPQREDFDENLFIEKTNEFFHVYEEKVGIPKMKFADECLSALRKEGYVLAVASSTRKQTVTRQLTNAGLINYFVSLTCGDSVVHSKPDPEIYLKAAESVGFPPAQCVAVEDSPNGVRAASAAGMRCIMIPDQIEPNSEIKKLAWKILPSLGELYVSLENSI